MTRASSSRAAFGRALAARDEISITVKGRKTGRAITLPIWFVLDGDTLWLLPVQGSRSQWFRNVRADPTMTIRAGTARRTFSAKASRVQRIIRAVVSKFRAKYGAADVARYYSGFDAAVRVPLEG